MRFNVLAAAASAALAIGFAAAAPAQAATVWDAVGDFSTISAKSSENGTPWSYGWIVNNTVFTEFNTYTAGPDGRACFAGIQCYYESTDVAYSVPLVAKNPGTSTISYADTVVHPTNVLNLHPGMTLDGSNLDVDAIVRFIAPTSSTYSFSGFFEALDNNPSGVAITINGTPYSIAGHATINNPVSTSTTGTPTPFSGSVFLAQGQTIDFRVNRAGEIWDDSTGLSAQIAAIPEPASWALMIVGFGAAGGMLRSRRRLTVA